MLCAEAFDIARISAGVPSLKGGPRWLAFGPSRVGCCKKSNITLTCNAASSGNAGGVEL
jgi:hypothetical protein